MDLPGLERHVHPSAGALTAAAAAQCLALLASRAAPDRPFCLALSGGRIAGPFYDQLVAASRGRPEFWAPVEFFFADERWVPLDHAESNYRLARERLFTPLGIRSRQVHPIAYGADPELAAAQLQAELLHRAAITVAGDPIFDLILLGMGEDGHVASLFPGADPAVTSRRAVYLPVRSPKAPPQRITLTYGVIAAAREVWVLIVGEEKRLALCASLTPESATPLGRVLRERKRTVIHCDAAAA